MAGVGGGEPQTRFNYAFRFEFFRRFGCRSFGNEAYYRYGRTMLNVNDMITGSYGDL